MKVIFLNPPYFPRFSRESRSPGVTKSGTLYYPKWLGYAAGAAIKEGHEVELNDATAANVSTQYVIDKIKNKGIEALVCDTSTPSIVNDIKVIDEINSKVPRLHIILVGRHVSALPDETFKMSQSFDFIAIREYEYTVRDWLAALKSGASMASVEGLVWKNAKGEVIHNNLRPEIKNLDELPFVTEVYKRFLNINEYVYGHTLHPMEVFDTSRGCPHKCTFCVYPQTFSGHKMRYRSVSNVADEFDFVASEFSEVKQIMLEDDTFIIHRKRTLELANELIQRGNKIPFNCNSRADVVVDLKFFKTLKRAGARLFCVGFESGDNEVLKHMRKNLDLEKTRTFMKNCKKAGIMVHGCFMMGNLNETRETLQKTLDLAIELKPDTAQFYPIMVYPGTDAYEEAKEKGCLVTEDFTQWLTKDGLHNSVVNLSNISHKELVEFSDYARKEFYFNPSYLFYKARQSLFHPEEIKRNLKGFKKLVRYLFKGSFA
ncbi:MAG: radical SAM protein [Candidatus Aminicenantes bacterium]|nr:MAG: radical SAM protein [Candidatus Aminicenantes bacterium]